MQERKPPSTLVCFIGLAKKFVWVLANPTSHKAAMQMLFIFLPGVNPKTTGSRGQQVSDKEFPPTLPPACLVPFSYNKWRPWAPPELQPQQGHNCQTEQRRKEICLERKSCRKVMAMGCRNKSHISYIQKPPPLLDRFTMESSLTFHFILYHHPHFPVVFLFACFSFSQASIIMLPPPRKIK